MSQAVKEVIRTGRKFDQVLQGAREVFMADGFSGASVDDIAKAAGVSKATLYSYFPDKRLLFTEVARNECQRQADEALELTDLEATPREALMQAAVQITTIITSEFSQRVFRICVAEADRFPELGQEFYESGPMLGRARITEYLNCAIERGEFEIEDMELAADQFSELCKTDLFAKMVFGIQTKFSEAEIERIAAGAVDMFLARYGTEKSR
ncbi:putative HTH-type transcriptional regulator YvdT [Thalassovita autumnalis]|uniref:HTH-type transcriptional regulator YvdT n=1 Tax=Thalassovita autumnalis TaxID=2072972 RepID=A0A0P1FRU1_9RHOB|nr:TetR/AcrR family transcriptional regulator [Thalassovita autumnalis]CUH67066.1 putative HTH-type transcriptional regulator YvdT [Thalassovita autumnalis]CUH71075.1 putative HTH-type transcriptional regulator YvdT [Thalassovita autumnalis]